ncbi:hypothetical protein HYC85_008598 [Camellia sinensis]|uniref:SWIRM domain-containing protein n=1 Tax=Camellia sinensis TaxID=4442 RepID=A0A7J7HS97_CAMSI|nr:hypothetical protein HYC85_008598 [Camellia sinensis]
MEREEKKSGSKKRSKPIQVGFDAADDEPIGALFKLKSKRNPKKVKKESDGVGKKDNDVEVSAEKMVVVDEDLGGMEDTLACFRKKLKGPKKDSGSEMEVGRSLDLDVAEASAQLLNGPAKGQGLDMETKVVENGEVTGEDGCDGSTDKDLDNRGDMQIKESKRASKPKKTGGHTGFHNALNGQGSGDNSIQNQKETVLGSREGSNPCLDDNLEDPLSAIFRKAPAVPEEFKRKRKKSDEKKSGSIRKSGGHLRSKNRWEAQDPQNGLSSDDVSNGIQIRQISDENMQENPPSIDTMSGLSSNPIRVQDLKKVKLTGQIGGIQEGPPLNGCGLDHLCDGDSDAQNSKGGLRAIDLTHDVAEVPNSISVPLQMDEIHQFDVGVPNAGLNDAMDQQLTSPSAIHISSMDQKISSSSGKDQEPCFDDASLNRSCEDASQETLKQLMGKILERPAKPPLQYSSNNKKMDVASKMEVDLDFHHPSLKSIHSSQLQSSCSALGSPKKEETSSGCDGLDQVPGMCIEELDLTSVQMCCSSVYQNQPSDDVPKETCVPNHVHLSGSGEANGDSSPSISPDRNGSYAERKGNQLPDPKFKDKKQLVVQRVLRKPKKHRHGDMAYEGDADWENLIQQSFLESRLVEDGDQSFRAREKFNSSSNVVTEAENKRAAAVSAGLKARAIGPVEKIKFKEVLKRKGGLQEYLQCRNEILGLWSKDVSRVLPLTECGVTASPSVDEPPRSSLVRDVYAFLDKSGYINVGIASEKDRTEPRAMHNFKLLKEKNFGEKAPDVDADDGVSFILGRVRSSEVCSGAKNGDILDDQNRGNELHKNGSIEAKSPDRVVNLDVLSSNPSCKVLDSGAVPVITSEPTKHVYGVQSASSDSMDGNHGMQFDSEGRKRIIVIGAGPAGLTAACHLQRQGFSVTVLEARSRVGGRVYTDRSSLSVPVDLGASIITGVEADVATERRPDPSSLVCAQLGLELTVLNSECPLYDIVTGQKVPAKLDEALEAEYNSLFDDTLLLVAQKGEQVMKMSLEDGLEYALKRRRMARLGRNYVESELHNSVDEFIDSEKTSVDGKVSENNSSKEEILSPLERRVMDWHFAHLEYGCAALLKEVSLPYWNQDDVYGGFGGAHCMIKGGYSTVVESLGEGLCIHLNHVVTDISYQTKDGRGNDDQSKKVIVSTSNGREFSVDAVLITVPLGCLKAEAIKFSPPLPQWKTLSIQRLGFGILNKVVLEFPEVFWDDSVDYFGATAEETNQRGQCFMFWNVKKTVGAPVLIALVVGKAAIDGQNMSSSDHVNHALTVLRKLFGEAAVPNPVASVVTDWGKDPFSYGAYSYVAVGASGQDYDILGRPVDNCLFFAGEATCKEHPDTVGGAMMSGLREAVRIIDILNTGNDYTAEVEAMEAAQRHSDSERNEVWDIVKRLEAFELSNVLYKNSSDGAEMFTLEALLQDMFSNAKTTAGRLHLAKELLNLPLEALKSFAGTKEGLSILNSWILDSMGKDGTQLLRHCVRLLVLVSTDLLAVRLSGIGKTVKEKVCVHTSRDIRAIASQLVNVWIEVFRKEKASNGGLKLLRQSTALDSLKSRSLALGKPPIRMHGPPDNKGSSQISASAVNHLPPNASVKRVNVKPVNLDTRTNAKLEVKLSRSQGSFGREDTKGEDDHNFAMSEEEQAALAAAEAARAAAVAAAEAYASSEAKCNTSLPLPKILSFHKFARREQYAQMDESDIKRKWSGTAVGRQDCISEIDSRNCRVRDWSVDFAAACVNLDNSKMSVDNLSQRSNSNEIACQSNIREHSAESAAVDSSLFTKAWVDVAGSVGLLMPLYKARKIDKEGYKSIMKKTATKVMEQTTDAEKAMAVFEFLDFKRKNKIRSFVDKLIERHMATKPVMKP